MKIVANVEEKNVENLYDNCKEFSCFQLGLLPGALTSGSHV